MTDQDHIDELLERHGTAATPEPSAVWVDRLESRLRARHSRADHRSRGASVRPVLIGAVAAGTVLLAAVAGLGRGERQQTTDVAARLTLPTSFSPTTVPAPRSAPTSVVPAGQETTSTSQASTASPTTTATTSTTTIASSGEVENLEVTVRPFDEGRVVVEWSAYAGYDFAGWRVGRFARSSERQPTEVYRSSEREPRRALDRPPHDAQAFYVVVAVDARGDVVARSEPTPAPFERSDGTIDSRST